MLNLGHVHAQSQNLPQSFFVSFHLLQNNDLKLNDSYIHHSATHYKKKWYRGNVKNNGYLFHSIVYKSKPKIAHRDTILIV